MTLPTFYDAGTASVANGATTITFHDVLMGTAAQPNFKAGDLFCDPAQPLVPPQRIESVDIDAGTAELAVAWPGTPMTSDPYEVRYVGDVSRSTAQTRRVLEELSTVQANGRGLFFRFSDSTTDSDPGAGYLRLNNADPSLATAAYINNVDADGATISGELDTWDDADAVIRGRLWLRTIADPSVFRAYSVTGTVVNGTGYRKLTLTQVSGSGSFAADDELMGAFARTGDKGDGYITDATVADPSELAALESEDPGYLVFVTDLETEFGAFAGRSGVVELVAGPDWQLVAVYTGPQGEQGEKGWSPQLVTETDGARRVQKLAGYVGGAGSAPTADVGKYLKGDGTFTAIKADAADIRGETGAQGLDGASQFVRVDFVATANVNLASGLANGAAAIDGVVLATGKVALLTAQTAPAENGLYICPAAGAASRHSSFNTFDSMPGIGMRVMEGSSKGDTLWFCNSNKGGVLGTTALTFEEFSGGGMPVGSIKMRFGPLDPGFLAWGEGGTFDRATYPQLAAWLDANGASLGLTAPQIAAGTIPNWIDESPRTAGNLIAVGAHQMDAVGTHDHDIPGLSASSNAGTSVIRTGDATGGGSNRRTGFTGGTETRVKAFGVRWQIKAFGAVVDNGTVVLAALAASVNNLESHAIRDDVDQSAQAKLAAAKVNILKNTLQSWEQIGAEINAANVAFVDWTSLSAYRTLRLRGRGRPLTAGAGFSLQVMVGGSVVSSAAAYTLLRHGIYATTNNMAVTSEASMGLTGFDTPAISEDFTFSVHIDSVNVATLKTTAFAESVFYGNSVGQYYSVRGAHVRNNAEVNDGIRLLANSGNLTLKNCILEGVRG